MRKIYLLSTLVLTIVFCGQSYAQDFSNKGKDFWVAYGYHQVMTPSGGPQEMVLYFAAEQTTNVTVSIPGNGYTMSYVVPANSVVTSNPLPKNGAQDCRLTAESAAPENKGIHITADKPIVAYAHIYNSSVSGASILFPTATLGKEYYSVNFTNTSNSTNANCWAYVVAADPGVTTVEITPSAPTIGHATGVPFTVTLNQGQVFNIMGQMITNTGGTTTGYDLSGTKFKSIATASGSCKRIAVFSGSGRISISCTATSSSSDNYMTQDFPSSAWGKKFLTAPAAGNQSNNLYRVCVSDPTTVVKINGVVTALPLQNNFFYQIAQTAQPQKIEADKPVTVSQYFTSQGSCGNGSPGDPEVIYLSPVEQNINKVLWNATPNFAILSHYFNVVIPNTGTAISSFKLKDASGTVLPIGSFVTHPQDAAYSYLRQALPSNGVYSIQSDSGFNAIAYGFGSAESYGYNAGTNIKDIFQFVSVQNQYATVNFPSTCRNTPFFFSMTFPYQPTSIHWDFHGLFPDFDMPDPSIYFTGNIVVGTKTLWQYKIPTPYTIPNAGTFPISVTATNPTPDGCGGTQEIEYDLQVFNEPVADFSFTNVCFPDAVAFTDISNTDGRPVTQRYWDFGDLGPTGNTNNPTHPYATPGTYTARYALITDIGCISDTTEHDVVVSPLPTASVAANMIEVCKNATPPDITFTGAVGTAPYTFTYKINTGPDLTVTTTGSNPSVTIQAPTNVTGTFIYKLVKVSDNSPNHCNQAQTGEVTVKVNELPTSSIAGGVTVCKDATPPIITFTGASGVTPPYTFTYHINTGSDQTITTSSGNSVTLTAPTNVAGTFDYFITSVHDGNATLCDNVQTGVSTRVTVNDLPTATLAGTTEVCVGATPPSVTFTGAGTVGPYEFTYQLNSGSPVTISGNNTVSITVPTTTAGTFTYTLLSVKDASSTQCMQNQTGTATVTVNALPTADFSITGPICETDVLTFNNLSTPNVGTMTNWDWDFGDSGTDNATSPTHTYASAGTYTVKLKVTNSKGCVNDPILTRDIDVHVKPVADFDLPEICVGDPFAQFNDQSTVSSGAVNAWNWDFGDAPHPPNTSNAQNGQHTYVATGVYNVSLTAITDQGCKHTLTQPFTVNSELPVSDFNALNPTTLCANDSVSIKDASSINFGSITKVRIYWDFAGAPGTFDVDDTPTPGKVYKHKYPNFQSPLTKTFTVRYEAFSGGTCSNIKDKNITVNAAPKVQFLDMPATCWDATPFQITQASELGGVPGSATYTGPGVSSSGIFNPATAGIGTHIIKYTYTSSTGGCVDTLSKSITVLDTASAQFSITNLACERSSVSFSSTASTIPAGVGTINGWTWDFGDPASGAANTSTSANPTHTFTGWGNYNVKLYVTTSNSCKSTVRTVPVLVNPVARPKFTVPPSACLPSATIAFTNASTIPDGTEAAFTYLWNFDDPPSGGLNTANGSSPSHIYNAVGPYNVNLQVTTGAGCVHDTTIVINTIHPQPTGSFTVSKSDVCIGQSITFTNTSNPADGALSSMTWDMDDANTRTNSPLTYTYASPGVFDVTLFITNTFGCKSTVATNTVTVNAYPVVNGGPDLFILEGGSDTLHPVVTATNPTYLWTPNKYFLSSNTIKDAIVKGVEDITYTLTVTGQGDCVRTGSVTIKVLKGPEIPNAFSPNGDGVHDKWVIRYLDTYPGGTVEIFNRYGQMIYHSVGYAQPWDGTIDGKPVPVGTYYYIVNPKNGRSIMSGYVDVIR